MWTSHGIWRSRSPWSDGEHAKQPGRDSSLIHHSVRGLRYVSIWYSECLAEASVEPLIGRKGDIYDNTLDKTVSGHYKTGLIHRRVPLENDGCRGVGRPAMGGLVQPP